MLHPCIFLGITPFMGAWAQNSPAPEPKHAYYLDEIAQALGVQPLRAGRGLPAGHREIRIWIGFGLFQPETFTRIQSDGNSVRGSHIFWWSTATDSAEESNAERDTHLMSNAELYASLRKTLGCSALRRRAEYEMCAATLATGQSWAGILASLDSLGIAQLPDGTALGLDGWSLVVEVREGSRYHSYSYFTPRTTAPEPEVRSAAAIAELVGRIGYRE
jgi:hypothetical protein